MLMDTVVAWWHSKEVPEVDKLGYIGHRVAEGELGMEAS
jgi:hypothetical protein